MMTKRTIMEADERVTGQTETVEDDKRLLEFCTRINEELIRGMVLQEKVDATKLIQFKNGTTKLNARHAWASRLVDCLEVHFRSVTLLRKDGRKEAEQEIKDRLTYIQRQSMGALENIEEPIDDFWLPVIEEATDALSWMDNRGEQLQYEASHIPRMRERFVEQKPNSIKVVPLFGIKNKELLLRKGETLLLVNNNRRDIWKVKNEQTGQAYNAPSIVMLMLGPNEDCVKLLNEFQQNIRTYLEKTLDVIATDMAHSLNLEFKKMKKYLNNKIQLPMNDRRAILEKLKQIRRITDDNMKGTPKYEALNLHLGAVEKNVGNAGRAFRVNQAVEDMKNLLNNIVGMMSNYEEYVKAAKKLMSKRRPIGDDQSRELVHYRKPSRPASGEYGAKPVKRVWEITYTMKEINRREEVTYVADRKKDKAIEADEHVQFCRPEGWTFGDEAENKVATTFQVLRSEGEQTTKFIIDGVVDPRTKEIVSMDEAIEDGILVQEEGIYRDITTGEECPIPEAMNDGRIVMTVKASSSTEAPSTSFGMVSVKKTREGKVSYIITHVVHPITGEIMNRDEAIKEGVLNPTASSYINPKTGNEMIVAEAIKKKLVYAELEDDASSDEEDMEMKHYVVSSVVDRRLKRRVSFRQATKSGLIDRETGAYIDSVTGQRLYVADAINRGFVKAKEIDDPEEIGDIEPDNTQYVARVAKLKKKILDPIKVISMFKAAIDAGTLTEEEDEAD